MIARPWEPVWLQETRLKDGECHQDLAARAAISTQHFSKSNLYFDLLLHRPTTFPLLQALSPYQAGILLVECFPYIPDIIMLMRELALAQEAPSSQELLTKGAVRYAEKQGAADIKVLESNGIYTVLLLKL